MFDALRAGQGVPMVAPWLTALGWISLALAVASATAIVADIYLRGHRQQMGVMEAVWPVNSLYFGPFAVLAYRAWGLPKSPAWLRERRRTEPETPSRLATVSVGVSHCGAGCTLGDIIAETAIFALGLSLLGRALFAEFIGDYVLAVLLGVVFQYFAIAPMRGLGLRDGLVAAVKADILSLTAFEVGLFGWMALMSYVFFPEPDPVRPDSPVYWFMMQIGMVLGFATAYPANVWLIRRGIKEAM
jgi:hypothetical protein